MALKNERCMMLLRKRGKLGKGQESEKDTFQLMFGNHFLAFLCIDVVLS